MRNKFIRKYHFAILIGVTVVLLTFGVVHILGFFDHYSYTNVPLHSAIEAIGAIMFIIIAILTFIRFQKNKSEADYPFIVMGFLGMGIFDLYHSLLHPGNTFVLSHIVSLLNGGFWLAMLFLPQKIKFKIRKKQFPYYSTGLWFILLFLLSFKSNLLPMLNEDGTFTSSSFILNSIAGAGFFAAAIYFIVRNRKHYENELFLLAVIAIIQGLSCFTFFQSEIWDIQWWLWHFYRFVASIILFYSVFQVFRKMMEDLENVNNNQSAILNAMPYGLMIISKDKRVIQLNKTAQILTGFSENDTTNQFCFDTVCKADCNKCPALDFKEIIENKEVIIGKKDGTSFPALKTVKPIVLNDEEVLLEGFVDITKIVDAEKKLKNTLMDLERSNKELEQFAYVSSHDLQEPLRKIKNYSDLLLIRNRDRLDDKGKKYLDIITRGATRMQKLIDDLLGISRVSNRVQVLSSVNTNTLVKEVQKNFNKEILKNEVDIKRKDLPVIIGDEKELFSLFHNLISNALKFKRDNKPEITISCEDRGMEWLFSVKDNGIGFDMKYAKKIFVIFQRLHARDEFAGTGIGLAMCKKIVERHGGRIWAESDPNMGSVFYIKIPK